MPLNLQQSQWPPSDEYLQEFFERAEQARSSAGLPARWELSEHFRAGRQEYLYDPATRRVVKDSILSRYQDRWVNILDILLLIKLGKVCAVQNRVEVVAEAQTERAVQRAQAQTALLRHFTLLNRTRDLFRETVNQQFTYGNVWLHTFWNPTKRSVLGIPAQWTGQPMPAEMLRPGASHRGRFDTHMGPVDAYDGPFGDVDDELVLPYEMYVPVGTVDWEQVTEFERRHTRPLDWVQAAFPQADLSRLRHQAVGSRRMGSFQPSNNTATGLSSGDDEFDSDTLTDQAGHVILSEYWTQRDGVWLQYLTCFETDNEKARRIPLAQNEFAHHGYTHYVAFPDQARFYSTSDVLKVLEPQRRFSHMIVKMAASERLSAKPLVFVPPGWGYKEDTQFHVFEVPPIPGAQAPSFSLIPNNFELQNAYMQMQIDLMMRVLGIYPVSVGETSGARSGTALEHLREEQSSVTDMIREAADSAMALHNERKLAIAYEYYDVPRLVGVFEDSAELYVLSKELLSASPRCKVITGGVLPTSKAERIDLGMQVLEKGLVLPQNQEAVERMLEWAGGSPDDIRTLAAGKYDIREQVEREHRSIQDGTIVPMPLPDGSMRMVWRASGEPVVDEFQPHDMEVPLHRMVMRTEKFLFEWSPQQRQMLRMLIQEHEMFQMQIQLRQAQAAQMAMQAQIQQQAQMAQADKAGALQAEAQAAPPMPVQPGVMG